MDLFMGGAAADEPAVCVVMGDRIRSQIDNHIIECKKRLIELGRALAAGRAGVDWVSAIAQINQLLQTADIVRPAIGDGPFTMTCRQWISLCNRFSTLIMGPDQMIEQRAQREAARAAEMQQQQQADGKELKQ